METDVSCVLIFNKRPLYRFNGAICKGRHEIMAVEET